jgi:hypothetical protein
MASEINPLELLEDFSEHSTEANAVARVSNRMTECENPSLPMKEGDMRNWDKERLRFASASIILEKGRRLLNRRTALRAKELEQLGKTVEDLGRRATQIEYWICTLATTLPNPTIRPTAIDDLQRIADLAEQTCEILDDLEIEVVLGESISPAPVGLAERNLSDLDYYLSSIQDWMDSGDLGSKTNLMAGSFN